MKLVFLLMVLSQGEQIRGDPIYYQNLNHCKKVARQLASQRRHWRYSEIPVKAWGEPRWIRKNVPTF